MTRDPKAAADKFDDEHYPAYTMGRAAEMLGTTPGFLRSLDEVKLQRGATLGPNSVILPAARLGKHATVGPVSLVMRGESVPDKTAWIGNPIGPWVSDL